MIGEFSLKNFCSFKDESVLSMLCGTKIKRDELEENFITKDNKDILKTGVIYGPNASGKSTILRAVMLLKQLVLNSHRFDPKETFENLYFTPFLLDTKTQKEPTELSISFITNRNICYKYSIKLTVNKIIEEHLVGYYSNKPTTLIDRKNGNITFRSEYFNNANKLKTEIRENQLALSVCADKNIEEALNIYDYFRRIYIFMQGIQNDFDTSTMLNNDRTGKFKNFLINLLQKADFSITNFYRKTEAVLFKDLNNKQKENILISGIDLNKDLVFPVSKQYFSHNLYEKGEIQGEYNIPIDFESMGTTEIFKIAGTIYNVMKENYVLFWDEFDKSLHPDLTRNIIETIHHSNIGGQFIFNTHDTSLLDTKELFRRDQIWFVEKNQYGESNLYSLAEFKGIRSKSNIEKQYLKGRYGAIPVFSNFPLFS